MSWQGGHTAGELTQQPGSRLCGAVTSAAHLVTQSCLRRSKEPPAHTRHERSNSAQRHSSTLKKCSQYGSEGQGLVVWPEAEHAISNLCVWTGCWECMCEGAYRWGRGPLSAVLQRRQKQHSPRRGPSIDTVEPQTAPAGVLSIKHWTAKPKGPVNQVVWPSVDKISISGNQVIFDSRSRCFGVTDKAPPQQSVYEKENWAYRANN